MKNKGFTLIELLAVIVILAIIALIATPVILGIINDSRTQAKKRSAEMVFTGVQYAYTSALYSSASGTTLNTNPRPEDIAAKFTADNATIVNGSITENEFKIETSDGAYCLVTVNNTAYDVKVKCGSKDDYSGNDLLAEKSAISTDATQSN